MQGVDYVDLNSSESLPLDDRVQMKQLGVHQPQETGTNQTAGQKKHGENKTHLTQGGLFSFLSLTLRWQLWRYVNMSAILGGQFRPVHIESEQKKNFSYKCIKTSLRLEY
ncbi:hypothetical protein GOODEAATRI_026006 [Goodea atripinnis]|uniref:Uncharacterized protein n=1 Tax=Goodea atripinnis TaxID=208336 RepID=A0ABV0MV77_9TELE